MAGRVAPAAEAVINADGEVLVVLGDAPGDVEGWTAGPGPVLCLVLAGGGRACHTLPEEALDAARANGRVLLAEVGEDGRPASERWVFSA